MERGAKYLPMIQNVFRAEGLPLDLAYIPLIESAFKPNALSRAKAKGIWQFMQGTALENGLTQNWYVDERSDPEKATRAAAKYLQTLHKMFDGDWYLALASYNGGPGRVQRAIKRSNRDDFWTLSQTSKFLPRETREYVPMILAAIIIARNPVQYGFEAIAPEPLTYDSVTIPAAVDLRRVAEWTGTAIDEIQALNPELRRWTTPVPNGDDEGYELKMPVGTGDTLKARLAAASPEELTAFNWHTVRKGETLTTIARKHKVTWLNLAQANHLGRRSTLRVGQRLLIPREAATLMATRADRPAPPVVAGRSLAGTARPPAGQPSDAARELIYRVKRGDTLFEIARQFKTTVANIKSWNRLNSNVIRPGSRLKILSAR
jgi:membrane-bound lytic murein transglycosylase D